jgi:predicted PurR-regulated permease PerM
MQILREKTMAKDKRRFFIAIVGLVVLAVIYGWFYNWLHEHILAVWILFTLFVAAYGIGLLVLLGWLLKKLQQQDT